VIADDASAADAAIVAAMADRKFGGAGERLVIEECLSGPEVSFFLICDGTRALSIGSAQDHKRIFDDDRGRIPVEWVRSRRVRCWMPPLKPG
jgi:phosphoribosylamine--glycine ligase